jgi:hypothetical protein
MSSPGDKSEGADTPRGFAVSDRRSFTDSGETREPDRPPPPAPAAASAGGPAGAGEPAPPPATETSAADTAPAEPPRARSGRLPPVDFPTFVLSLGSSALMHLGEAPHPGQQTPKPDLTMAKHTIDLLSMLEEKTRGNLNPSEAQLMENLLFDLRLRYVEATKK